jgi:hypothetical protein
MIPNVLHIVWLKDDPIPEKIKNFTHWYNRHSEVKIWDKSTSYQYTDDGKIQDENIIGYRILYDNGGLYINSEHKIFDRYNQTVNDNSNNDPDLAKLSQKSRINLFGYNKKIYTDLILSCKKHEFLQILIKASKYYDQSKKDVPYEYLVYKLHEVIKPILNDNDIRVIV